MIVSIVLLLLTSFLIAVNEKLNEEKTKEALREEIESALSCLDY